MQNFRGPGAQGNLGAPGTQEENRDALVVTQVVARVGADLSLSSSREYMIAQTVAMRVSEVYTQRMNELTRQVTTLQRILNSQNQGVPNMQNVQNVQNQQALQAQQNFQMMQQMGGPRRDLHGFGMNMGIGGVGGIPGAVGDMGGMPGPTLPQVPHIPQPNSMDALKMEPGAKRKLIGKDSMGNAQNSGMSNMPGGTQGTAKKSRGGGTSRWTKEQDEALQAAVAKFDGRNWKAIAELVPGRDHVQCLQRWKKVLRPGLVKGHWSPEEDALLLQLIQDEKMHSWAMVASKIKGRTAKQCRERWSLNLDPGINRSPWTPEEDALLLQLHEKMGGKWSEIKTEFDGRTENAVKTRFKSLIRAKAREWTQDQDRKLIQLRMKYGKNWAAIKKEMPGRSRNAIKVRCKTLEYDNNITV